MLVIKHFNIFRFVGSNFTQKTIQDEITSFKRSRFFFARTEPMAEKTLIFNIACTILVFGDGNMEFCTVNAFCMKHGEGKNQYYRSK